MLKCDGLKGLSLVDVMERGVEKTYIIFSDGNDTRWYNKYLKKGFRHCSILYYDGYNWFRLEQTYPYMKMEMVVDLNGWVFVQCQNISRYYQNLPNYTVLEVDRNYLIDKCGDRIRWKFPFTFDSCVEFVKRWCAIREYFVITPYQLYKHLTK